MTTHARAGRGQAGRSSGFHGRVAVTTINAVVTHVMLMTELNRLLTLEPLACVPGRAIDRGRHEECGDQNKDSAKNADLRQRISAVMENLWHAAALLILKLESRESAAGIQIARARAQTLAAGFRRN